MGLVTGLLAVFVLGVYSVSNYIWSENPDLIRRLAGVFTLTAIGGVAGLSLFFYNCNRRLKNRLHDKEAAHKVEIDLRKAAEDQLRVAKDKAEMSSKAKSEFLTNISHEIRTPMNSIIGFCDILREESLSAEQADYVNTISNNSRHLLELINDVLDISMIESDQLELELFQYPVLQLVKEIEAVAEPLAREKGLPFRVIHSYIQADRIVIDAPRLRQCILNLIKNAVKFTHKGYIHLYVTYSRENGQPILRFEIEDTGIGIPESSRDMIFESFTQADAGHSRRYGGAGLGLYITRQLLARMGGTVSVQSHEGHGSTFTVVVPTNEHAVSAECRHDSLV